MSKGWESKNVEEQQAEASAARAAHETAQNKAATRLEDEARTRRVQALELQRERVLSEQTSNPHRRSALEAALATIERDLEQLGWSIKL